MLRGIRKQISLVDRSMLWLKELYIQLYYENGGCEPLASDALRVSLMLTTSLNEANFLYLPLSHSILKAFGGTDYSFLSTTTSTTDSVHSAKKDLAQQQGTQPQTQQSTPTTSMKKKRSVVNLFCYNNVSELLTQQQPSPSSNSQQQTMHSQAQQPTTQVQQSIPSSLCDTNSASAKRYSAFNNISFDTNLDFLSFVSLYRSFR